MDTQIFPKELAVCSNFWHAKINAEYCVSAVFSTKDFLGSQSAAVIEHMLDHKLCAECIKLSGKSPIEYLKSEIGLPRFNLILLISLAKELAWFQVSFADCPPSTARIRQLTQYWRFVFQEMDLENWGCTKLLGSWIESLGDVEDNKLAMHLMSERLSVIGLLASKKVDLLYVPRACPDVWRFLIGCSRHNFVDESTQTDISRKSDAEDEECVVVEHLSTSCVSIKPAPARSATFNHPQAHGVRMEQGPAKQVTTQQPPAQSVIAKQPLTQNASMRQAPAQGVTAKQAPEIGVTSATNTRLQAVNIAKLSHLAGVMLNTDAHSRQRGLIEIHCFAKCSGQGPGVRFGSIVNHHFKIQHGRALRSEVTRLEKGENSRDIPTSQNSPNQTVTSSLKLNGQTSAETPKRSLIPFSPPPVVPKETRARSAKQLKRPPANVRDVATTTVEQSDMAACDNLIKRQVSPVRAAAVVDKRTAVTRTPGGASGGADASTNESDDQSSDSDIFVSPASSFSGISPEAKGKNEGKRVKRRQKSSSPVKPVKAADSRLSKRISPPKKKRKASRVETEVPSDANDSVDSALTENNKSHTVAPHQRWKKKWTLDEDRQLYIALSSYLKNRQPIDYSAISTAFDSRSAASLRNRWASIRTNKFYLQRKIRDYLKPKDSRPNSPVAVSGRSRSMSPQYQLIRRSRSKRSRAASSTPSSSSWTLEDDSPKHPSLSTTRTTDQ